MQDLILVDKDDLRSLVADLVTDAYKQGYQDANDHYISVNEAAGIMRTSTKKVYRDVKNNKFENVLDNPVRLLKSEVLLKNK